ARPSPTDLAPPPLHDALPIFTLTIRATATGGTAPPPTTAVVLGFGVRAPLTTTSTVRAIVRRGIVRVPTALVGGRLGLVERGLRSEEHTSELQSRFDLVCRLL